MQNYHDGNRPVSVAPQGSKPQGSKTWDFMETTLVALLAYGAYLLVGGLALTVLMATQGGAALSPAGAEAIPRGLESAATIVGCAATVVALWIAIRRARRDFSEYLALNWPTRDEAMAGLMIAIMVWIGQIVVLSLIAPPAPSTSPRSFIGTGELLILFVAICVAAPIMEEFTVRGFIFRGWSESLVGPNATIVLTAAIWGACHTQYDWWGRSWVFLAGLALGHLRRRSNSTWLTVIVHSGMNFFFFLGIRAV